MLVASKEKPKGSPLWVAGQTVFFMGYCGGKRTLCVVILTVLCLGCQNSGIRIVFIISLY